MDIPTRKDVLAKARRMGQKVAAVLPIHYPRALFRAFGVLPMEVWGPPHVNMFGEDRPFQDYTCPIVQHATAFLSNGASETVDCVLIPHTCDSLQGMASVLQSSGRASAPVLTLYHPRGRRQSDLDFLTAELRELARELGGLTGKAPTDAELTEAIARERHADRAWEALIRNRPNLDLSDREYYTLLRSREYLPAEDFVDLAAQIPHGRRANTGPGILLSGIVPEPMELFDRINGMGAHVAADDLACCHRRLYRDTQVANPYERLARQLTSMPPDPTVSTPIPERNAPIVELIRESGARGVLVYDVKFCEPELFYVPMLADAVKEAGIPFLHVEVELETAVSQQVLNRIGAFVEVLA